MKATLEFNIPEEQCAFNIAARSMDWALIAHAIVHGQLRSWWKYGHEFKSADEAIDAIRQLIFDTIAEHGVSLDDIE